MKLIIDRAIRRVVDGKQSAAKRLAALERLVDENKPVPQSLLKASGQGRTSVFQPYRNLGLHHATLDYSGAAGGDPLLIIQKVDAETYVAVAIATHESYATSDHDRCRRWLWANRTAIDWDVSAEAKAVFESLKDVFSPDTPLPDPSKK